MQAFSFSIEGKNTFCSIMGNNFVLIDCITGKILSERMLPQNCIAVNYLDSKVTDEPLLSENVEHTGLS